MISATVEVLDTIADAPLVLYGHSLGSLVAFETARALERRSRAPLGLIVSGRRAPSIRPPQGREIATDDDSMISFLRRLGGIDPALLSNPDILELVLPVLRSDSRLANSYVPEPGATVHCPLTVLNGDTDPQATSAEAAAWHAHTTGDFVVHEVAGGHFFFDADRPRVLGLFRSVLDGLRP